MPIHQKLLTAIGLTLMTVSISAHSAGLTSTRESFGAMPDGTPLEKITLSNSHGMKASIITYGATLQALEVPDKQGRLADVVLGFDDIQGYQANPTVYFGATIGRFGNRLAGGQFTLGGKTYSVPLNDKTNSLHGGSRGFDKHVWQVEARQDADQVAATFTYRSPDGEMGFPGTLSTEVTYSLNERNELRVH